MTGSNKLLKINMLFFFPVILLFFQCNKTQEVKDSVEKSQIQNVPNFEAVLKCSDYAYDQNYFLTADYGCIYNPKGGNPFGNLIIYLIPKSKSTIPDDQIDSETEKVNNLSIEQIKKDFDIYIYLIPKGDLNYNPQGDPVYYQKEKYKEQLFSFKNDKWQLIDSIMINHSSENQKEQQWREDFMTKLASPTSPHKEGPPNPTESNENSSIVLSCGSGCAMTYNVKKIIQKDFDFKVQFTVHQYIDEDESDTFDENFIFSYDNSYQLKNIVREGDENEDFLKTQSVSNQKSFTDFAQELVKNKK